jgi:hypothetical protein
MHYLISGFIFFLALVVVRFAELPANVTPLLAAAVFAPRLISQSWARPAIPILVLITTDYFLGWYTAAPMVYACIIMASILGSHIKNLYVAGTVSVMFWHVLVNGAVWFTGHGAMSLWQTYAQAITFDFRLLVSTLVTLAFLDVVKTLVTSSNKISYEKNS